MGDERTYPYGYKSIPQPRRTLTQPSSQSQEPRLSNRRAKLAPKWVMKETISLLGNVCWDFVSSGSLYSIISLSLSHTHTHTHTNTHTHTHTHTHTYTHARTHVHAQTGHIRSF